MTGYGVCDLSMIPVRKQPSEKAEMVNQLLFGELLQIDDNNNGWYLIRSEHDSYEGWVDKNMVLVVDQNEFTRLKSVSTNILSDISAPIRRDGIEYSIVMGSRLPVLDNGTFFMGNFSYNLISQKTNIIDKLKPDMLINHAMKYINAPYLWGGRTPFGIDCSGFVQVVYLLAGISLKRDSGQQALQGETIDFIEESKPGDLAFFDNEEERIIHVGIIIEGGKILHSSGYVRIDRIDHQGIYRDFDKRYSHKLRLIKRVLA